MKDQRSLTYAKQNFKRNIYKYGEFSSFENAVLTYYLNKEEIENLKEYATKIVTNKWEMQKIKEYQI